MPLNVTPFTASCLPWVPEQGTVGASGDLAPLSHLALGMMGEGHMWSPQTGWGEAKYVLESQNLTPIQLGAKEGNIHKPRGQLKGWGLKK